MKQGGVPAETLDEFDGRKGEGNGRDKGAVTGWSPLEEPGGQGSASQFCSRSHVTLTGALGGGSRRSHLPHQQRTKEKHDRPESTKRGSKASFFFVVVVRKVKILITFPPFPFSPFAVFLVLV